MKYFAFLTPIFIAVLVLGPTECAFAENRESCRSVGQLYGMDLANRTFLLKSDAGDISNIRFDGSTIFVQTPSLLRLDPTQVNVGDRLCIQASDETEPIKRATVTRRVDIASRERAELSGWQARSAFGVITALDSQSRRLTLKLSDSARIPVVTVDASGPVTYQSYATGGLIGVASSWNQLSPGDYVYVRGEKSKSGITARLIATGGFRTITGTIESVDTLEERLRIRTLFSGASRTIEVGPGFLYETSQGAPATRIDFADLQPGDAVLVLTRGGGNDANVHALAVIGSFSSFGFGDKEDGRLPWIIENGK